LVSSIPELVFIIDMSQSTNIKLYVIHRDYLSSIDYV
jgi:hypothetical protein